jgi:hypothetical protein
MYTFPGNAVLARSVTLHAVSIFLSVTRLTNLHRIFSWPVPATVPQLSDQINDILQTNVRRRAQNSRFMSSQMKADAKQQYSEDALSRWKRALHEASGLVDGQGKKVDRNIRSRSCRPSVCLIPD